MNEDDRPVGLRTGIEHVQRSSVRQRDETFYWGWVDIFVGGALHIVTGDSPTRAAGIDIGQVDAEFHCKFLCGG